MAGGMLPKRVEKLPRFFLPWTRSNLRLSLHSGINNWAQNSTPFTCKGTENREFTGDILQIFKNQRSIWY